MKLQEQKDFYIRCFELADKQINHGITSVIIFKLIDNSLNILNWVISCRVFSRSFEEAILTNLHKEFDKETFTINFKKTKKNIYGQTKLEEIGFTKDIIDDTNYSMSLNKKALSNLKTSIKMER